MLLLVLFICYQTQCTAERPIDIHEKIQLDIFTKSAVLATSKTTV